MNPKRFLCLLLILSVLLLTGCGKKNDYPSGTITGIIQWGAGGGTDTVMRPLCSLAAEALDVKIVPRNVTGGSGSIGLQKVYDAKADGYTLLLGAENPVLYRALGILDHGYDDFECILLVGDETVGIAVNKNAPYTDLSQLIADALARPGQITCATTGEGGLPWQVAALLYSATGAQFKQIPYDSDATARTAVMNGECVFTACKIQSGLEAWKSGDLNYLCLLSKEPEECMPGVPAIADTYPEFASMLPWGPFYGVFVKKGTPQDAVRTLTEAYQKAFASGEYRELLDRLHINPLGLSGEAAREYYVRWENVTVEALKQSGCVTIHEET